MIRAVIFDLDDTLYAEAEYVRSGFTAVGAIVTARFGRAGFLETAWQLFVSGVRHNTFDRALLLLGISPEPEIVADLVNCYRCHTPKICLAADAERFLAHVEGRLKLGLITDGASASQRAKIAALGLTERFDVCVCTDDLGREHWKPSPLAFQIVARGLGCGGSECLYVGDNPAKDFVAPNALGWRTAMVARPDQVHAPVQIAAGGEPACRISSLDELVPLLTSFG